MGYDFKAGATMCIPGHRRLWKYTRDTDDSLIVFATDALPEGTSVSVVHDSGRAVGLRRTGESWLVYKVRFREWSRAGRADSEVMTGLPTVGSIPY